MSAVLTRQGFGLLASVALLAACASVRPAVITPRLGVTDLEVIDFGVFEQRYRVQLRVQNPNPNVLHIRGLDYTLHINEQEFARGVSDQSVRVPAFGEALVEMKLVSSLAGLVAQLNELSNKRGDRLPYRFSGRVSIGSAGQGRLFGIIPLSRSLPFDYQGELSFPQLKHVRRERRF